MHWDGGGLDWEEGLGVGILARTRMHVMREALALGQPSMSPPFCPQMVLAKRPNFFVQTIRICNGLYLEFNQSQVFILYQGQCDSTILKRLVERALHASNND